MLVGRERRGPAVIGFLLLGAVVGLAHAFEADHLAAMAGLATDGRRGRGGVIARGAAWGLGHTATLFLMSVAVISFGAALTDTRAAQFEFAVGVMLVLLGLHLIWRMRMRRVHFHAHDHGDGPHLHAHSHAGSALPHAADPHDHRHPARLPWRALGVGLMHGAAGSAGLIALATAATENAGAALAYVLAFGTGSIAGMTALTAVAAWPLALAERRARRLHRALALIAALATTGVGLMVMTETAALAWG